MTHCAAFDSSKVSTSLSAPCSESFATGDVADSGAPWAKVRLQTWAQIYQSHLIIRNSTTLTRSCPVLEGLARKQRLCASVALTCKIRRNATMERVNGDLNINAVQTARAHGTSLYPTFNPKMLSHRCFKVCLHLRSRHGRVLHASQRSA